LLDVKDAAVFADDPKRQFLAIIAPEDRHIGQSGIRIPRFEPP